MDSVREFLSSLWCFGSRQETETDISSDDFSSSHDDDHQNKGWFFRAWNSFLDFFMAVMAVRAPRTEPVHEGTLSPSHRGDVDRDDDAAAEGASSTEPAQEGTPSPSTEPAQEGTPSPRPDGDGDVTRDGDGAGDDDGSSSTEPAHTPSPNMWLLGLQLVILGMLMMMTHSLDHNHYAST